MGLRPPPARWFEVLTDREDLAAVLRCLGDTGAVELQHYSETRAPMLLPDLSDALDEFANLSHRYGTYWPTTREESALARGDPGALANKALVRMRGWVRAAKPLVEALQAGQHEAEDLALLANWLESAPSLPHLDELAGAGPWLAVLLAALPTDAQLKELPTGVLTRQVMGRDHNYLLAVGMTEEIDDLERSVMAMKGRLLRLPESVPPDRAGALAYVEARLAAIDRERRRIHEELAALDERFELKAALADFAFLEWLSTQVPVLPVTEHFAWVTGWTSDPEGGELRTALEQCGAHYLLRFPEPPAGLQPPLLFRNPSWAKPFEVFARLLGTPAAEEADPSRIVAVVAPLMFGYMFGDVGQGLILMMVGLVLRKRWPPLGLLVTGGFMSMVFGLAFGSIFAMEGVIPALWVHPLEEPVPVLLATLVFGAGVILLGLGLGIVTHYWRHERLAWWAAEPGLVVAYGSILIGLIYRPALFGLAVGSLWFLLGRIFGSAGAAFAALGQAMAALIETLLQLVVNTISFLRVGAFALAHAGLSAAVVGVGEATGSTPGFLLVLVLGNVLIMSLEGLVVAIQTTRLVLFEFFIRFLEAGGRPFRPLSRFGSPMTEKRRET